MLVQLLVLEPLLVQLLVLEPLVRVQLLVQANPTPTTVRTRPLPPQMVSEFGSGEKPALLKAETVRKRAVGAGSHGCAPVSLAASA